MDDFAKLCRLLRLTLLEIRHEAQQGGDLKMIAGLADLVHQIPSAFCADEPDYTAILEGVRARARDNPAMTRWLESNIS